MSIHLIVTDLDGTLLNSEHQVSPFTQKAINEAIAQSVLFTVATGKTFPSTPALIDLFNIQIPVICGNGTQVFAPDGQLLYEDPIPLDIALEALQMALTRDFTPIVYTQMGLLAPQYDANVQELVDHHEPMPEFVPALEQALRSGQKPYKLVLMHQNGAEVNLFQQMLEHTFADRAQVLRSGLTSVVEVLPGSASKGNALDFILRELGLTWSETMCLGDNCNDLDMIVRAGIGVAMEHAPLAVRNAADMVTGTNDNNGVGHAIRQFVLEPIEVTKI